ncbi:MAG TPA: SIR2 family protein [Gemmatimonadales bacterium]
MTISESHFTAVTRAFAEGRIIPFLGAGANLCDRPDGEAYARGRYLPSGVELATHLSGLFDYPSDPAAGRPDLVRVSQYVAVVVGTGPLYDELRAVFDADYPPSSLHQLLAGIPGMLRAKGYRGWPQLLVTTNYDDALEHAFQAAGESYDVLSYIADGENRGRFRHWTPDRMAHVIERPNEYRGEWRASDDAPETTIDQRTVILKLHGACVRDTPDLDSYVITEDHYIEYLTRTEVASLLPITLAARMRRSHFLFLGYSLADWNLRVILHRIWGTQSLRYKSWAVQKAPGDLEVQFWRARDVDILEAGVREYADVLSRHVAMLPAPASP